jgi:hypothetical protein
MSSIALGVWVPFLKQPALPGEAPQTKKKYKSIIINKTENPTSSYPRAYILYTYIL